MEFSKEINQTKPFTSESIKAMLNVAYTASIQQDRMVDLLKPYEINDQHYNVLRILNGKNGEPSSPGQVKAVLINSRGDLTRLMDKLVKMELVDRANSKHDRRSVELLINKKGKLLLERIAKEFNVNKVYDFKITEKEAKQLNGLLDKLRG
ncbi:MAG: MarR family 2-MHQ and catechol resistance regulon transcriptional repressor [Crocinitomix sp.]|jgi:MarR family 2-MHQ and catechol resistance regulon transcriptional repressor